MWLDLILLIIIFFWCVCSLFGKNRDLRFVYRFFLLCFVFERILRAHYLSQSTVFCILLLHIMCFNGDTIFFSLFICDVTFLFCSFVKYTLWWCVFMLTANQDMHTIALEMGFRSKQDHFSSNKLFHFIKKIYIERRR